MKMLSRGELQKRLHDHNDLSTDVKASRMAIGRLDVDLLKEAGLRPDPILGRDPLVRLDFDHMSLNVGLGRADPVYRVYELGGTRYFGHYAAAAFSELRAA